MHKQNGTLEPGEVADNVASSLHKAALYVLAEKNHVKVSGTSLLEPLT